MWKRLLQRLFGKPLKKFASGDKFIRRGMQEDIAASYRASGKTMLPAVVGESAAGGFARIAANTPKMFGRIKIPAGLTSLFNKIRNSKAGLIVQQGLNTLKRQKYLTKEWWRSLSPFTKRAFKAAAITGGIAGAGLVALARRGSNQLVPTGNEGAASEGFPSEAYLGPEEEEVSRPDIIDGFCQQMIQSVSILRAQGYKENPSDQKVMEAIMTLANGLVGLDSLMGLDVLKAFVGISSCYAHGIAPDPDYALEIAKRLLNPSTNESQAIPTATTALQVAALLKGIPEL